MTENELKEIENRAYQIKEEIQNCVNKNDFSKMVKLSLEFKELVYKLKKAKKELIK